MPSPSSRLNPSRVPAPMPVVNAAPEIAIQRPTDNASTKCAAGGRSSALLLAEGGEAARKAAGRGPVPVYFIGVGEQLEDLQTFKAREFALALLG